MDKDVRSVYRYLLFSKYKLKKAPNNRVYLWDDYSFALSFTLNEFMDGSKILIEYFNESK